MVEQLLVSEHQETGLLGRYCCSCRCVSEQGNESFTSHVGAGSSAQCLAVAFITMRDISSAVTAVKSNNLVHGLFAITGGGASAVDRRMLCLCSKELGEVVADSSAVFSINDVDSGVFGNTPCFDQRAFES